MKWHPTLTIHVKYEFKTMTYKASKSDQLIDAARQGRAEDVRILMNGCPRDQKSSALRRAAEYGHVECVKILIPVSDPKDLDSDALRLAAHNGHAECVRVLIPVSDPNNNDSVALVSAAMKRHAECVRLLIDVSSPKSDNSRALQWASFNNDQACFDLLYAVSDPQVALSCLLDEIEKPESATRLLRERMEMERQRLVINKAVCSTHNPNVVRKM